MKKLITLFAIVSLFGSCKKESNKIDSNPAQSKLFVVDLQSSEPQGSFFNYSLKLNGADVSSPATVHSGDLIKVIISDPFGYAFRLKCNLDNSNVYPNYNYQYSSTTWDYTVN